MRRPADPPDAGELDEDAALAGAVARAQRGDEDAFRLIYQMIQPGLIRYLWVQVGDAAEDVASETWLQIARDLGRFKGDGRGFRGWTVTIARHRALDHVRRQRCRPQADGWADDLVNIPAADDTAGSVIDSMATRDALAMIARLPPDQAEAVLLRAVIGLDCKTAGKVAGKRPGAVRTAAYRGLRTLAGWLSEAGATQVVTHAVPAAVTPVHGRALKNVR